MMISTELNSEQVKALSDVQTAVIQAKNVGIALAHLNIVIGETWESHTFHPAAPTDQSAPEIAHAPSESEILEKIKDLIHEGTLTDATGKPYKYKINSSVKKFVSELKARKIVDHDSLQWIYQNVLLPKRPKDSIYEQVTWQYFRREFSRKNS